MVSPPQAANTAAATNVGIRIPSLSEYREGRRAC
jgi:hypothetical protein